MVAVKETLSNFTRKARNLVVTLCTSTRSTERLFLIYVLFCIFSKMSLSYSSSQLVVSEGLEPGEHCMKIQGLNKLPTVFFSPDSISERGACEPIGST